MYLDSQSPETFLYRGLAKKAKGDLVGAIDDYDQALLVSPDHVDTYYERGLAYQLLRDQESLTSAVEDFQKYLALGGGIQNLNEAEIQQRIFEITAILKQN